MTLLVLIGTISSGHMFWHQARAFHVGPSLGLAVLFLAGTFYCVTTSAGRNAVVVVVKSSEAQKSNGERHKLEADIVEAKEDLRKVTLAVTKECASGEGPKCKGVTKVQDRAYSHVLLLEARLSNMKAEQVENADIKHAAKVFAALPFVTAEAPAIERALLLFFPFVKAMFLEIATIVFLGIGLGRRVSGTSAVASETVSMETVPSGPSAGGPSKRRKPSNKAETRKPSASVLVFPVKPKSSDVTLAYVQAELAAGRIIPSQDHLAAWAGVSKSAVSKWLLQWECNGQIARGRSGRCKVIGRP
ncbi:MAG: hypothetical protein F9K29_17975 [Hyphomicrobiaceae bacterium]|nr:MAG: hypothetical protein F9K29_17975 [Hyphomicrobiaceae bacterium]